MLTLALVALAPTLLPAAHPDDWPQFLGPARSGVVEHGGWAASGAEQPLWKRNVGRGYSCPSIVGRRLVTCGHDTEAGQDLVQCLDRSTGEVLWLHSFAATDDPSYHGGGTLTTPAIRDGVVYTINRHGRAYALALETGEVLWTRDYRSELELSETFHGYCASPVVEGERIALLLGGVAAVVRREDGALLWRTEDHGDGAYTNSTVFLRDGRALLAAMLAQTFFVFDLENGDVVHRYEWPLQGNAVHVAQPLVLDDRVLLSTAYGKGTAMLRMGAEVEPELLWTSRALRNKVTGVYLHGEHLYGFDESMLKCFDLEGNEMWRVRGLGMGALSIAGGRLLVLSSRGELVVAEANPEEYRELSRAEVLEGGDYWTMPVLVDGRIYVRNSLGDLACLDHRGRLDAGVELEGAASAQPPPAEELFAAHGRSVGAARIRSAHGLTLTGRWAIPGRGQSPTPARWAFQAPNRWRLGLESGARVHVYDGELAWELLNGAARLVQGAAAEEAPSVCILAELFAPAAYPGARTLARPTSFLGRPCWAVESRRPGADPESPGPALRHYFAVETGRLVGREGDGISTMAFHGRLEAGGASVPERITIYRAETGQEETFAVAGASWIDEAPAPFVRDPGLLRLLRTAEEIARDEALLRDEYGDLLGRYRTIDNPDDPEEFRVAIDRGDLAFLFEGDDHLRLVPLDDLEDAFELLGTGANLHFRRDEEGSVVGVEVRFGAEALYHERVED